LEAKLSVLGRVVSVGVDLEWVTRTIEDDDVSALTSALFAAIGARCEHLAVQRESGDYEHVVLEATLRAASTFEALRLVEEALAGCLMLTGLFEQFDVTGSRLRAGPSMPSAQVST
jgi:hypothetical protein